MSLVINELDGHPSAALHGVYGRKLCDAVAGVMGGGFDPGTAASEGE